MTLPDFDALWLWVGEVAPYTRPEKALAIFREHLASSREDLFVMVVNGGDALHGHSVRFWKEMDSLPAAVRERIVVLNNLSDEEMAWLYRRAELFLCTSGHKDFCLPVMEARSFGLRVRALSPEAVSEALEGALESFHPASVLMNFFSGPGAR